MKFELRTAKELGRGGSARGVDVRGFRDGDGVDGDVVLFGQGGDNCDEGAGGCCYEDEKDETGEA